MTGRKFGGGTGGEYVRPLRASAKDGRQRSREPGLRLTEKGEAAIRATTTTHDVAELVAVATCTCGEQFVSVHGEGVVALAMLANHIIEAGA